MEQQKQQDINSQLKRTLKDSFIYIPARILPAVIGIVLIRVLTTLFTPEEYGYYQITLSTFSLLRLFAVYWLSTSVIRFYQIYKQKKEEKVFFSTLLISAICGILIVSVVGYLINTIFFHHRISGELFSLINLAIGTSIFNAFLEIFIAVYNAGLEPKKYTFFWASFAVIKPIIGIGLIIIFGFRVNGVFWGFLLSALILDFIIFYKLKIFVFFKIKLVSLPLIKDFLSYGIPLTFTSLSLWILSLSDRYLLGYFGSSAEVGIYSVGYAISEKALNFIYTILLLAAFPIIVNNWEKYGQENTQQLITEISRFFFLICSPILIVLVSIPEHIVLLFSDSKFIGSAKILPIISIGIFIIGLNQYVLKGFELHKKSQKIALLAFIAGVTDILLNILLIPRFGYRGAAISALIAYLTYFILSVWLVKNVMKWIPPIQSIMKISLAGLILAIFLKAIASLTDNVFTVILFGIPCGVFLFYITLYLIREISRDQIKKAWNYLTYLAKG